MPANSAGKGIRVETKLESVNSLPDSTCPRKAATEPSPMTNWVFLETHLVFLFRRIDLLESPRFG